MLWPNMLLRSKAGSQPILHYFFMALVKCPLPRCRRFLGRSSPCRRDTAARSRARVPSNPLDHRSTNSSLGTFCTPWGPSPDPRGFDLTQCLRLWLSNLFYSSSLFFSRLRFSSLPWCSRHGFGSNCRCQLGARWWQSGSSGLQQLWDPFGLNGGGGRSALRQHLGASRVQLGQWLLERVVVQALMRGSLVRLCLRL